MSSIRVQQDRSRSPWWNPSQWDPWHDFEVLRRQVQQLSERPTGALRSAAEVSPAIDICDTGPGFIVRVDLPGVRDEDLDVTLDGSLLSVRGSRSVGADNADATLLLGERSRGRFVRTVGLPADVASEEARATLARGVLEVIIPKRPSVTRQKVSVTVVGGPRD